MYRKQVWTEYNALKTEEENIQTGAVVTAERMNYVEEGIGKAHENVDNHVKEFNNPHKTTSEQVGAYSKEEANKKFAALGSSYTKKESKDLFIEQIEAEKGLFVVRDKVISTQDWDDLVNPGIYIVGNSTGKHSPSRVSYGNLVVFAAGYGITQLYICDNEWQTRTKGVVSGVWSLWEKVAFTTNVVNLTESQTIGGVKDFVGELKINGIELNSLLLNPSSLEQIKNVGKKIWSGAWYMGENQSINPSLPLDQCLSGWLFLYQPYNTSTSLGDNWDLNYVFVPKTHIVEFGGRAVVHHLETLNGAKYNKYIYISNTQILGHKNNNTASKTFVLTRVYAI